MFRKPVKSITVETISRLGNEHVISTQMEKTVSQSNEKEMAPQGTSPFSVAASDDRVEKSSKNSTQPISSPEGTEKRHRGDHILWIE